MTCLYHPDRPTRDVLDGDPLCQACCDAWARAEGEAARDRYRERYPQIAGLWPVDVAVPLRRIPDRGFL